MNPHESVASRRSSGSHGEQSVFRSGPIRLNLFGFEIFRKRRLIEG